MWFDITRYWYRSSPHLLTYFLWPLAYLYGLITLVRRYLYRLGILRAYHFPVPIIVVGNITVGGTGKTPFVIWLARFLQSQGYKPGIVSRGVGGIKHHVAYWVTTNSSARIVGDEALLLVRNTGCPVMIGVNRPLVVDALLQRVECDIVISDDGLQHYSLARDIEMVMIDGVRRFGNAYLLPAGPLREPLSRLNSVDFTIVNGEPTDKDVWSMTFIPGNLISVCLPQQTISVTAFSHTKVHAIAGIGHPERFFSDLKKVGFDIIPHIFPDHYLYDANDFHFNDLLPIIMTEKDAVKCLDFADARYWYWPITVTIDQVFEQSLLSTLTVLLEKKECVLEKDYLKFICDH